MILTENNTLVLELSLCVWLLTHFSLSSLKQTNPMIPGNLRLARGYSYYHMVYTYLYIYKQFATVTMKWCVLGITPHVARTLLSLLGVESTKFYWRKGSKKKTTVRVRSHDDSMMMVFKVSLFKESRRSSTTPTSLSRQPDSTQYSTIAEPKICSRESACVLVCAKQYCWAGKNQPPPHIAPNKTPIMFCGMSVCFVVLNLREKQNVSHTLRRRRANGMIV